MAASGQIQMAADTQRAKAAASAGLCFAPGAATGFADHDEDVYVGPVDKDTSLPTAANTA